MKLKEVIVITIEDEDQMRDVIKIITLYKIVNRDRQPFVRLEMN